MTVSRVVRGSPGVAPEKRAQIEKAIYRLGYRTHPFVSAFMTEMRRRGRHRRNAGNIGWMCGTRSRQEWATNPAWASYFRGAQEAAATLGYTLSAIEDKRDGINGQRLTQILRARGICGIILPPLTDELDPPIDLNEFSFVRIGGKWAGIAWHKVMPDYAVNQHIIWRELTLRKLHRVGLFVTSEHLVESQGNTLAGFLFNQQVLPASRHIPPLVVDSSSEMSGAFRQWRKRWRPDVIITDCSAVREWVGEQPAKRAIQEPPYLVHLALSAELQSWAGIDLRQDVQGGCALEMLNGLLLRNETGPPASQQKVLLAGVWRDGATLPHLPEEERAAAAQDPHFLRPHWYHRWTNDRPPPRVQATEKTNVGKAGK